MGPTLLGIDVDEAPLGWLVESLLDDDDLAKLAETDGGRPAGGDRGSNADPPAAGGTRASDESDAGAHAQTGGDHDADPNRTEQDEGRTDPLVTRVRRGLLYLAAAGFGVGLLAALVRRVLGRFESDDDAVDEGRDDCAASGGRVEAGPRDVDESRSVTEDEGRADDVAATDDAAGTDDVTATDDEGSADESDTAASPRDLFSELSDDETESPLGALVALAFLALVAALVRKFGTSDDPDDLGDV